MVGKITFGVALGLLSGAVIGYCVYFDYKRRSDPNYKQKVYERRMRLQEKKMSSRKDPEQKKMEDYFIQELQNGEAYLMAGDIESAVDHICKAVVICSNPPKLITELQRTLPSDAFNLLIKKMQIYSNQAEMLINSMGDDISVSSTSSGALENHTSVILTNLD